MNILKDLWYGNLHPYLRENPSTSRYKADEEALTECEKQLMDRLPEAEKELLMDLEKYQMHILNTCECDSFITGFRLGTKIMLEVLGGEKSTGG